MDPSSRCFVVGMDGCLVQVVSISTLRHEDTRAVSFMLHLILHYWVIYIYMYMLKKPTSLSLILRNPI